MAETIEALNPWDMQQDETAQAYEAFEVYRDMGVNRSQAKAATSLGKSEQLMFQWSRRHEWVRRVAAFDRHVARNRNQRIVHDRVEMRERLITQAKNIQVQVAKRVLQMTPQEIDALKPSECVSMLRLAADLEMKAREVPGSELEESADRVFAPTFTIEFLPTVTPEMVTVRLPDGQAGYIPRTAIDAFREEFPEATVLA